MSATSSRNAQSQPTRKLVYGHAQHHNCLAFADAETAAEEAREIIAIASASTWGEARRVPVRHTWNPAVPDNDEDLDEHSDDVPFDIFDLSPVADGFWPGMATSRAITLLPEDLQDRFGNSVTTILNGGYLEIPLAADDELVTALQERGFEVARDDDLINALDGRTFNPMAD